MKEILKQIYERILGAPISSMIAILIIVFILLHVQNVDATTLSVLIGSAISLLGSKDK